MQDSQTKYFLKDTPSKFKLWVKKWGIIIGAIWLIGGGSLEYYYGNILYIKRSKQFEKANIHSIITSIYIGRSSSFRVNSDEQEYFIPMERNDNLNNDNKKFYNVVLIGDSVAKGPYDDTLYLFKKDKTLRYTFKKVKE